MSEYLSTAVISMVIALCAWGLKGVFLTLTQTLIQTMAKMEMLDAKIILIFQTLNEFPKMQGDLNNLGEKLRALEQRNKPRIE